MKTVIELNIEIGQIVYINHEEYQVKKIFIERFEDKFSVVANFVNYQLEYLGNDKKKNSLYTCSRSDFMNTFEYKSYLIDLVNSLDDIRK